MLKEYFDRWKKNREQRVAKKEWLEKQFEAFLLQTQPFVPSAPKHPHAALFRHMWKRAKALELIYQRMEDSKRVATYSEIAELAAKRYYDIAPEGPYGKVTLKISSQAMELLLEKETQLLLPHEPVSERHLACVYMGLDENNLVYVGQTLDAPERRWKEHRIAGSGPFKKGASYVQWRVLHGPLERDELDELESYYIGLYDAYKNGHNEGRGNAWQAYERGCKDRLAGKIQA